MGQSPVIITVMITDTAVGTEVKPCRETLA